MSRIYRRAFLAGAGSTLLGSALADAAQQRGRGVPEDIRKRLRIGGLMAPVLAANRVRFQITIRGLCAFMLRKNPDGLIGSVDIVLMRTEPARKKYAIPLEDHHGSLQTSGLYVATAGHGAYDANGNVTWELDGARWSIEVPNAGPVEIVEGGKASHPWQDFRWVPDFTRLYPNQKLIEVHTANSPCVAAILTLKGGRLEAAPPSRVTGWTTVWKFQPAPIPAAVANARPATFTEIEQVLTDTVVWSIDLPVGSSALTAVPTELPGRTLPSRSQFELQGTPGTVVELLLEHDVPAPHKPVRNQNALLHNLVFYDLFENPPDHGHVPIAAGAVPIPPGIIEDPPREPSPYGKDNRNDPLCNGGKVYTT